jgi:hypothetical protein
VIEQLEWVVSYVVGMPEFDPAKAQPAVTNDLLRVGEPFSIINFITIVLQGGARLAYPWDAVSLIGRWWGLRVGEARRRAGNPGDGRKVLQREAVVGVLTMPSRVRGVPDVCGRVALALGAAVVSRFEAAPEGEHRFLREFLHLLYAEFVPSRPVLRGLMGRFLAQFVKVWNKAMAVGPMLEVGIKTLKCPAQDMLMRKEPSLMSSLVPI